MQLAVGPGKHKMAATFVCASEICTTGCACGGQRPAACLGALFRWLGPNPTDSGSGQAVVGSVLQNYRGLLPKAWKASILKCPLNTHWKVCVFWPFSPCIEKQSKIKFCLQKIGMKIRYVVAGAGGGMETNVISCLVPTVYGPGHVE